MTSDEMMDAEQWGYELAAALMSLPEKFRPVTVRQIAIMADAVHDTDEFAPLSTTMELQTTARRDQDFDAARAAGIVKWFEAHVSTHTP